MGVLVKILQKNKDLYAWSDADMPGINPKIITHKLAICQSTKPVAQKRSYIPRG